MIGAALAIGSGLASAYGSMKSAQANNASDALLKQRQSALQSWYDKEYNTNYLDTTEARGSLQVLKNDLTERQKKVNQNNVIKGASDEVNVASGDQAQKVYANAVTRLAGYGTQRKDMIGREFRSRQEGLDNLQAANLQNKSAQWSNFMNNATNLGIGAAEADGMGAFDKWDGKIGNWYKGKVLAKKGGAVTPVTTSNIKMPSLA
jgi:hypothetical protein